MSTNFAANIATNERADADAINAALAAEFGDGVVMVGRGVKAAGHGPRRKGAGVVAFYGSAFPHPIYTGQPSFRAYTMPGWIDYARPFVTSWPTPYGTPYVPPAPTGDRAARNVHRDLQPLVCPGGLFDVEPSDMDLNVGRFVRRIDADPTRHGLAGKYRRRIVAVQNDYAGRPCYRVVIDDPAYTLEFDHIDTFGSCAAPNEIAFDD